ncbi:TetR family transcriptional regulator [Neolewinella xylanilytica]|uniref:TetR family transcriptional regulator n=1 Tax=Neolewinella xylanilytica TaxID=1514080 RepID=A0A2S6I5Y4_9BACT|nr:TetR/AcrR family transcriptional regulator [Neolewinella xylanilytica]PPK86560.1 TetR family transcriptional regulator [Neolewinella xylanilytica]
MKKTSPANKRSPGRPRGFDRQAALETAMKTFWAHGYETTSISDLSRAMGINAPAIYSAFGDKKQLFLEAMRLYRGDPQRQAEAIAGAASAREAAAMVLANAIRTFTGKDTPKGCLVGTGLATGSPAAADVRAEGTAMRDTLEALLAGRIERDVSEGVLPPDTDAGTLAALVSCTVQGFSTLARDGASAAKLHAVTDLVLQGWPKEKSSSV